MNEARKVFVAAGVDAVLEVALLAAADMNDKVFLNNSGAKFNAGPQHTAMHTA